MQVPIIINKNWDLYEKVLGRYNNKAASIGLLYNKLLTDYSFTYAREKRIAQKSEDYLETYKPNVKVSEKIKENTFHSSEQVKARVTREINNVLSDAYNEGLGREDVVKKLNEKFTSLKEYETRRIAVTEINSSRNTANYQQIQNDNISYKQWITAEDNRVRPSHVDLHGHITRTDNKFSNGLLYPGDKSGSIKEWITCRCVVLPYFIPWGKEAPDLVEFTEDQLVNADESLDDFFKKFNKPKTGIREEFTLNTNEEKALLDFTQGKDTELMVDILRKTPEWNMDRLTQYEKKEYLRLRKNKQILEEAVYNKKYNHLNEIDNDDNFFKWNKQDIIENKNIAIEEIEEYNKLLKKYEKRIKDENIEITGVVRVNLNHEPGVKNLLDNGEIIPFKERESFKKYHFKKENITIFESLNIKESKVKLFLDKYKSLPKNLQIADEIIISSQQPVRVDINNQVYRKHAGYVLSGESNNTIYTFRETSPDTITHESWHLFEKDNNFFISNSKDYVTAFYNDRRKLLNQRKHIYELYPSQYAQNFTERALNGRNPQDLEDAKRLLSENSAEIVKNYVNNPDNMRKKFPEQVKIIEKALNGEYNPNTTVKYTDWVNQEIGKYNLTKMQRTNKRVLELQKNLKIITNKGKKQLNLLNNQIEFSKYHDKLLLGKKLTSTEEEKYKILYKKLEKKLKLKPWNKRTLIFENEEEITNYNLTKNELKEYEELKNKSKLKFKEKRKLKEYNEQIEFNELYIKKSKEALSLDEEKRYKELYSKFKDKFNLSELEQAKNNIQKEDTKYVGDTDNLKNYKQFKGTSPDGMLPGNESIDNYFTKNVSTTGKYDEIINKWVYKEGYKDIQFYDKTLKWDKNKLKEWIKNESDFRDSSHRKQKEEYENILIEWEQFHELMKEGKLKKNMVLHRSQEKLYMGNNPRPGDVVTLPSYRSTSISKEGMDYYKDNVKDWWDLYIYAPAGTKGVYISPKAINPEKNNKYIKQMETILGPDTKVEILEIKSYKREIYLKVVK